MSSLPQQRRSMPIFRVRTGCLTCRRRKKKCCETKPVCRGCKRNKLSCQWPRPEDVVRPRRGGQPGAAAGAGAARTPPSPAAAQRESTTTTTVDARPAHSPPRRCRDSTHPTDPPPPDLLAAPHEALLSSASPSGSGTSSSGDSLYEWSQPAYHPVAVLPPAAAALGLDLSGIVFDVDFPVEDVPHAQTDGTPDDLMEAISPRHLAPASPPPPLSAPPPPPPPPPLTADLTADDVGVVPVDADLTIDTPSSLLGGTTQNPAAATLLGLVPRSLSLVPEASDASLSLELLGHYLSVTTRSMDNGSTPDNPFIVQLVPLAFSSDLVLQLILTQSAVHRASRLLPGTSVAATQHYNQSLRMFQRSISSYSTEHPIELLTLTVGALIMCFVETAKGDINGTVFDHLMAARWLLLAFLAQKSTVPRSLRDFLIEYYVYTASLSMVSIDSRVSPQCLLGDELEAHGRALVRDRYVGSLCGCWLELLLSIPTIFNIGRRFLADAEAARPATADDFALFATTYNQIQSWTPDASVHPDVALAGRFYQQAMIVYLYTALDSISAGKEAGLHHASVVQTAVSDALGYLAQIPPTARINTSLCWPIAVVGSCVAREDQKDLLRARLDAMFKAIGLGNICQTSVLLERVWETPDSDPWNICHVMQEHQIWISFA
ncbi:hypothetical protein VTK73DRAFT_5540 [Phialemonium thermophilum]|uniref:Zn(2)-C6 fungal-type domain-containing protein n=1 Tax=Phialemonium thermophilum TaxID=223376 RepID=A0ABR3WNI7_9PEZI